MKKRFDLLTYEGILARDTEGDFKCKEQAEELLWGDPYLAKVIEEVRGMHGDFEELFKLLEEK